MLLNCGVGEDSWESLGLSNQSIVKEIIPEYSLEGLMQELKLQCLATWCEELTHLKRPWCWEKLKVGEGDDRGWDGWMTSLIQWTWVWVSSGNWWWTGRPGVLQSMGWKIVTHDWAPKLNWRWRSWDKSWLLFLIRELFSRFWSQSLVFCNRFVLGGFCLFVCFANKTSPKIWPSSALWKQES